MAAETEERIGVVEPTVFIGLGGTGKEILLRIRRRFYEEFGKKKLPCTDFLWLDTDANPLRRYFGAQGEPLDEIYQAVSFEPHEMIPLLEGNVGKDMADIFDDTGGNQHIHRWLYPEIQAYGLETKDGAGNIRSIGRLSLFNAIKKRQLIARFIRFKDIFSESMIKETINIINLDKADIDYNHPRIFVISSVAGGTGTGTLLDILFLLRHLQRTALKEIHHIIGIVVLPDVYFKRGTATRSYGNAYSALQEIEYYTLMRNEKGQVGKEVWREIDQTDKDKKNQVEESLKFSVDWDNTGTKKILGPPASVIYFFQACTAAGIILTPDNRKSLFRMIADALYMDFLPGQFSTNKRSVYSNVTKDLASPNVAIAEHRGHKFNQFFAQRYATFGFSKIEIPENLICLACASHLAMDILKYWNREKKDPYVMETVRNQMGEYELSAEKLSVHFGNQWIKDIKENKDIANLFVSKRNELKQIDELKEKLAKLESELLNDKGTDATQWGLVINLLHMSRKDAQVRAQKKIEEWIDNYLDNEDKGLQILAREESGYLRFLKAELDSFYKSVGEAKDSLYDVKIKDAERKAYENRDHKDKGYLRWLDELKETLSNKIVALLGMRNATLKILLKRVERKFTEFCLQKANVCLYEQLKLVSAELAKYVNETAQNLRYFSKKLSVIAEELGKRKEGFLNFGEDVLCIRIFDYQRDWSHFYKLGLDREGRQKEVDPKTESRDFLHQNRYNGKLGDLFRGFSQLGEEQLKGKLINYCDEVFRMDFRKYKRQVEVVTHPEFEKNRLRMIKELVRTGLPCLDRDTKFVVKSAHLGISSLGSSLDEKGERYKNLIEDIKKELENFDYSQIDVLPTGNPSQIYLYTVGYAFPLPGLEIVSNACREAYHQFYNGINTATKTDRVPLHIDRTWEGKFGDLKIFNDREREILVDITEVLLLGSVLRVLDLKEKGYLNYGYNYREMTARKRKELGSYYHAIKTLSENQELYEKLRQETEKRKKNLTEELQETFLWTLIYLDTDQELFPVGSVEKSILTQIYKDIIKGNIKLIEKLNGEADEAQKDGFSRKEVSKQKLNGKVDWIGGMPIMKELPQWLMPEL